MLKRLPLLLVLLPAWAGASVLSKDIVIYEGSTWIQSFTSDVDLTNQTLKMEIRDQPGGTLYAAPLTTPTNPLNGVFLASLTAGQTRKLTAATAVYDVTATAVDGTVTPIFRGNVSITRWITQGNIMPGMYPPDGQLVQTGVSSADFNAHVTATTNVHGIADTSKLVTTDTAQTISASKAYQILGAGGALVLDDSVPLNGSDMVIFKRHNDSGGQLPLGWDVATMIDSQGAWWSNSYMTISGIVDSNADPDGVHRPLKCHATVPYMFCVREDVFGPGIVSRALGLGQGGYSYASMSDAGAFNWAVDDSGGQWFGNHSTLAALDVHLWRPSALTLRTNGDFRADGIIHAANRLESESSTITYTVNDGGLNARESWPDSTKGSTYTSFWEELGNPATAFVFNTSTPYTLTGSLIADFQTGGVSRASILAHGEVKTASFVSTSPVLTACTSAQQGAMAYVDNSSDLAVSHMCFCGTGADDATYAWRRMDAPGTTCP